MRDKYVDWKDIANGFYDKCLALSLIMMIFIFIVFPNIESITIERKEKVQQSIEILPEIQEKVQPPEEVVKPLINITFDEEDDNEDTEFVITMDASKLDMTEIISSPITDGNTPKFVYYEQAPVILQQQQPDVPDIAKKMKVSGQVILEIEILADGRVGAVNVLKTLLAGPGGLDEAAVNSVKNWRFQPAQSGGQPVACWITQPIMFDIK
jgi:protein TonB